MTSAMNGPEQGRHEYDVRPVHLLSLVHPDFLPTVYSLAQVLRDNGFAPSIVSFSSLASGSFDPGTGVTMVDCGPHAGTAADRRSARRRFRAMAERLFRDQNPVALIATCPFSYLESLRLSRRNTPVIYFVEEIYEVNPRTFARAPLTAFRNWAAERRLSEATLVAAPSDERAEFIGARARLARRPYTVLNCPYVREYAEAIDDAYLDAVLPERFHEGMLVVNTGRVSNTQGIVELIQSVAHWPDDAKLVVTGVRESDYAGHVRDVAAASPRQDDICLLPVLPRAAMLALQRRAHVGICLLRLSKDPATQMPAPNKVGEYLRWGMVIVASRLPFLDQLECRGVGELVDVIDPQQIARGVERAVDRARRQDTRANVQQVSREWVNMEVQAIPILRLLQNGVAAGRR